MIKLIIPFIILRFIQLYCKPIDTIPTKKRSEEYRINKDCYDILVWEEVLLKDKAIERKINDSIKSAVKQFKADEKYIVAEKCVGSVSYEFNCTILFAQSGFVSVYIQSLVDYQNARPAEISFKTINFDAGTGRILNLKDYIEPAKLASFDSLIIEKMKEEVDEYSEEEIEYWKEQLENPEFVIQDHTLSVFIRTMHCGYCMNVDPRIYVSGEDIMPYMKAKTGLTKALQE